MARYIDVDALKDKMYHEAFETDTDMQKWDSGCWIRYKMFENAISTAPSIDIEPKRGEWKEKEVVDYEETTITQWQSACCSVCGKYHTTPYLYYFDDFNFCPNCGADMRGADRKE